MSLLVSGRMYFYVFLLNCYLKIYANCSMLIFGKELTILKNCKDVSELIRKWEDYPD